MRETWHRFGPSGTAHNTQHQPIFDPRGAQSVVSQSTAVLEADSLCSVSHERVRPRLRQLSRLRSWVRHCGYIERGVKTRVTPEVRGLDKVVTHHGLAIKLRYAGERSPEEPSTGWLVRAFILTENVAALRWGRCTATAQLIARALHLARAPPIS